MGLQVTDLWTSGVLFYCFVAFEAQPELKGNDLTDSEIFPNISTSQALQLLPELQELSSSWRERSLKKKMKWHLVVWLGHVKTHVVRGWL